MRSSKYVREGSRGIPASTPTYGNPKMPHASCLKTKSKREKKSHNKMHTSLSSPSNPLHDPTESIRPLFQSHVLVLVETTPSLARQRYASPALSHSSTARQDRQCTSSAHPAAAGAAHTRPVQSSPHRGAPAHHRADPASPTLRSAGRPVGDRRRGARELRCVTLGVLSVLGDCPETLLRGWLAVM